MKKRSLILILLFFNFSIYGSGDDVLCDEVCIQESTQGILDGEGILGLGKSLDCKTMCKDIPKVQRSKTCEPFSFSNTKFSSALSQCGHQVASLAIELSDLFFTIAKGSITALLKVGTSPIKSASKGAESLKSAYMYVNTAFQKEKASIRLEKALKNIDTQQESQQGQQCYRPKKENIDSILNDSINSIVQEKENKIDSLKNDVLISFISKEKGNKITDQSFHKKKQKSLKNMQGILNGSFDFSGLLGTPFQISVNKGLKIARPHYDLKNIYKEYKKEKNVSLINDNESNRSLDPLNEFERIEKLQKEFDNFFQYALKRFDEEESKASDGEIIQLRSIATNELEKMGSFIAKQQNDVKEVLTTNPKYTNQWADIKRVLEKHHPSKKLDRINIELIQNALSSKCFQKKMTLKKRSMDFYVIH